MFGALMVKRRAVATMEMLSRGDLENYLQGWADDGVFVYPGDVEGVSGPHRGKDAIRKWFQHFFEHFPTRKFSVKHVAVSDLFDLTGNNVVAIHWTIDLTNRSGLSGQGTGVTIATIRNRKVIFVQDFIFDTGEQFRAAWQ